MNYRNTKEQLKGSTDSKDSYVILDVEGKLFKTTKQTIKSIPGSLLSSLDEQSPEYDPGTRSYCFDRDSKSFKYILEAHRFGEIHVPKHECPIKFRKEMEFWRIPTRMLPSCCWKTFYDTEEDVKTLNMIIKSYPKLYTNNKVGTTKNTGKSREQRNPVELLQNKIWLFLEEPQSSTAAKVWCFFYIFMVLFSVLLNLLWVEEDYRVDPYLYKFTDQFDDTKNITDTVNRDFNGKIANLIMFDPHQCVFILDIVCTLFFCTEVVAHFMFCPDKLHYILDFYRVIKVTLSLVMLASLALEVRKDLIADTHIGKMFVTLKMINMLRILLILRLRKLYISLHIIILSIQHSGRELLLLMVVFSVTILIYGGMMFCAEIDSDMFPNTLTSMWWALITMTTVGYGDFYPTQTVGYILGSLCAINGLIVIALPIAAIASNFASISSRNADYQKYLTSVRGEKTEYMSSVDSKTKTQGTLEPVISNDSNTEVTEKDQNKCNVKTAFDEEDKDK